MRGVENYPWDMAKALARCILADVVEDAGMTEEGHLDFDRIEHSELMRAARARFRPPDQAALIVDQDVDGLLERAARGPARRLLAAPARRSARAVLLASA